MFAGMSIRNFACFIAECEEAKPNASFTASAYESELRRYWQARIGAA